MQRLIDGHRLFRSEVFPQKRALLKSLAEGQKPPFLFITCSDSRINPNDFTQTDAGEMFIDRSIGNLVPEPGGGEHEALAVIEYAVIGLGVRDVIVCGHSHCGAMQALLDPERMKGMPSVAAWLANAEETRVAVARKYAHLQGEELLSAAVRENVVIQLDHLRRLPCIASRLEAGTLQVHGWVFEFEHGAVEVYHPESDRFEPFDQMHPLEAT